MDPFLLTHKVRDGLYDVGPRLAPISIRDQMLRSYALVTRAFREKLIGPGKPLLVVGAGAAGATAAMVAARLEVPTTLLEQTAFVFSLQGNSNRYLDPTIYDWPADHCEQGKFAWKGPAVPLFWEAGYSNEIAEVWENALEDEVAANAWLTFIKGAKPENADRLYRKPCTGPLEVYFKSTVDAQRRGPFYFAMIVSCAGAGLERVDIGNFRGKRFWDVDTLSANNLGLPEYEIPRVVISGAGDGALQDFIRIVTDKSSVKELYLSLPDVVRKEVSSFIASKEDHYQRSFVWSGNYNGKYKSDDCNIQKSLHQAYEEIVARMLSAHYPDVKSSLEPRLRLTDSMIISLVFECEHFSHCYPLNRFLVLLLARFLEKRDLEKRLKRQFLQPNTRIIRIEPSDKKHVCDKNEPHKCDEESHEAFFVRANCTTPRTSTAGGTLMKDEYNVVIVRHGVEWSAPLFGCLPMANHRHQLPYYLGW